MDSEMLFFWVLPIVISSVFAGFSCKDQDGKDVDWFAVYKMPIEKDTSANGIASGTAFYYVDVNKKDALVPSPKTLDDKDQAIAHTLQQFYDRKSDLSVFHVMYNDEPYEASVSLMEMLRTNKISSDSIQFGHTKGVSFFDEESGVWLIHSVPKFPPPDHYEYPTSGHDYGQTMLCLSFKYSQLAHIGTQLYYNHPDIYSSNLPTKMAADYPDLAKVIGGQFKQGAPYSSIIDLTTVAGQTFKSFAKTNELNNDLYDALVAPILKSDLVVESWRRGSEVPVSCGATYHAVDALDIKIGGSTEFKYTKDHSKWVRSSDASKPYICIGDINRMTTQYVRGGGTECILSSFLWRAFDVIVDDKTKC